MYLRQQDQQFLDEFTPVFITSVILSLAALYTVVCNYEPILDAIAHSEWVDRILSFYKANLYSLTIKSVPGTDFIVKLYDSPEKIKTQQPEKKYVLAVCPEPIYINVAALRR